MGTIWVEGNKPKTKFARRIRVPIYLAQENNRQLIKNLTEYILKLEDDIISHEDLVSSVPKSSSDPYKHTQQWKQHNLFNDVPGLGGEALSRFPPNPVTDELLALIRVHYLTFLADLGYPRQKVYVHGWANVLRKGEWISKHAHITNENSYLAGTYYLTTNNTKLYLENIVDSAKSYDVETQQGRLLFFPSWVTHWSDPCENEELRISIALDIVTEETMQANPWRPHKLFDDPDTMPGIDTR